MGSSKQIHVLTKKILVASCTVFVCIGFLLISYPYMKEIWGILSSAAILFFGSIFLGDRIIYTSPREKINADKKAVLISGCDSGFGHELAKRLHQAGFQVFAACLYPETGGGLHLREAGMTCVFKMDVTKAEDVAGAKKYVEDHLDGNDLWAVVNNAGIGRGTEIEFTPMDHIEQVFNINLLGVIRVTKAFLPLIRKNPGRVVNVASSSGRFPFPGFVPYGVSKDAVIGFSDGLRLEMHKWGVQVVTIEPWMYRTPFCNTAAYSKEIEENWTASSKETRDSYGANYIHDLQKTSRDLFEWLCNPNVHEVTDIMEEAITDDVPKYYYSCGKWYLKIYMGFVASLCGPLRDTLLFPIYYCCTIPVAKSLRKKNE